MTTINFYSCVNNNDTTIACSIKNFSRMDEQLDSNLEPKFLTKESIRDLLTKRPTNEEMEIAKTRSLTTLGYEFSHADPGDITIYDFDGNQKLDCTGQAWTLNLGYCQPDVIYGIYVQMQRLTHVRYNYVTIPRVRLIKALTEITPGDLKKVCFNNEGGSLALETAIKLALLNKKKAYSFLTYYRAYHGATLAMFSAGYRFAKILGEGTSLRGFGLDRFQTIPYPYCYRCPMRDYEGLYGEKDPSCDCQCLDLVEEAIIYAPSAVAGIMMEPIQGPGGHIPAPKLYLERLRKICDDQKVFLIFDESQTNMGKVGDWFASNLYGVTPDILTVTKSLGGGFPIGATIASERLRKGLNPVEEHTTFGSNPIMFAAALVNIEVIKHSNIMEEVRRKGAMVTKRLKEMQDEFNVIGDIRGPGLFIGIEIVEDRHTKKPSNARAEKICEEAWKRGVLFDLNMPIMTPKNENYRNILKYKPPLVITDAQIDRSLEVLRECLQLVSD
ncbi:MAG: aspartate aminotransferase family protein [Candidatus Helarchaeota archaeon]